MGNTQLLLDSFWVFRIYQAMCKHPGEYEYLSLLVDTFHNLKCKELFNLQSLFYKRTSQVVFNSN